jgi:antitoxin component YwqK of YwqJK toxin-antitoxin module
MTNMKLYYKNGNLKYEGQTVNNEPNGSGIGYWEDMCTVWYKGDFKNGKPIGKGQFYYRNGQLRYEGESDGLQYVGEGTEFYENGNIKFTGFFRKSPHFFMVQDCL